MFVINNLFKEEYICFFVVVVSLCTAIKTEYSSCFLFADIKKT